MRDIRISLQTRYGISLDHQYIKDALVEGKAIFERTVCAPLLPEADSMLRRRSLMPFWMLASPRTPMQRCPRYCQSLPPEP